MYTKTLALAVGLAGFAFGTAVQAAPVFVDVYALNHSLNSGAGAPLSTGVFLSNGDHLVITAASDDLWSAGAPPRDSNANGLGPGNYPCGTCDDGTVFPPYTYNGFTFAYGSLVGQIGSGGDFFKVGTSYDQIVAANGELRLWYWDTFTSDNSGYITAKIDVNGVSVPEPATLGLLGLGLLGAGLGRRRKVST